MPPPPRLRLTRRGGPATGLRAGAAAALASGSRAVALGRRWLFLRRRARAALLGRLGLRHQPSRHEPLPGRPEVGRQPVEHQAGREVEDEGDEEHRQDHQQDPLRPLHRRRHEVRRRELARHVDDEEQRAPAVLHRLGDVDEVEPVDRAAVDRQHVVVELAQDVEERDEDRDLEHDRQARGGRVDLVLLVELHQLLVLALLVVLLLLLERLHLGRVRLQVLHRVDLLHGDRHEHDAHEHGQRHDRPRPREADRLVQPDRGRSGGSSRAGAADSRWRRSGRSRRALRLVPPAAEVRVLGPVDPAVAPRVAAQKPPAGEERRP